MEQREQIIETVKRERLIAIVRGVGGNIIDKQALKAGDYPAITELAKQYVSAIRELYV